MQFTSIHWAWERELGTSLNLELGQLDSSPVFTTSCLCDLEKSSLPSAHLHFLLCRAMIRSCSSCPSDLWGSRRWGEKEGRKILQNTYYAHAFYIYYLILITVLQCRCYYFLPIPWGNRLSQTSNFTKVTELWRAGTRTFLPRPRALCVKPR